MWHKYLRLEILNEFDQGSKYDAIINAIYIKRTQKIDYAYRYKWQLKPYRDKVSKEIKQLRASYNRVQEKQPLVIQSSTSIR
jgi:hypothetical protein